MPEQPSRSASRARVGVIFFTVLIDLIGFGIVLPILPYYAQRFGAAGLGYGAIIGIFSLMQFVATALLGKLSDRIGRRPVLLTTMLVNAVGYTLFAFAGSYWVLFLSRNRIQHRPGDRRILGALPRRHGTGARRGRSLTREFRVRLSHSAGIARARASGAALAL